MIKPVHVYGSSVLRTVTEDIDTSKISKKELKDLVDSLYVTLYNKKGIGLAAPQIGVSLSVFVVDTEDVETDYPELKDFRQVYINPFITEYSKEKCIYGEGCLSIPGVYEDVERSERIVMEYLDENLKPKKDEFTGFLSRIIQHEYDHLDGVLFTDLLSPIKRKMINSKLKKIK